MLATICCFHTTFLGSGDQFGAFHQNIPTGDAQVSMAVAADGFVVVVEFHGYVLSWSCGKYTQTVAAVAYILDILVEVLLPWL